MSTCKGLILIFHRNCYIVITLLKITIVKIVKIAKLEIATNCYNSLLFFGVTVKNVKTKIKEIQFLSSRALHSVTVIWSIHHIWLHGFMIKISADIELNPGTNQKQDQSLLICHWNLNSKLIPNVTQKRGSMNLLFESSACRTNQYSLS